MKEQLKVAQKTEVLTDMGFMQDSSLTLEIVKVADEPQFKLAGKKGMYVTIKFLDNELQTRTIQGTEEYFDEKFNVHVPQTGEVVLNLFESI